MLSAPLRVIHSSVLIFLTCLVARPQVVLVQVSLSAARRAVIHAHEDNLADVGQP